VGPDYKKSEEGKLPEDIDRMSDGDKDALYKEADELLTQAYLKAMEAAKDAKIQYLAFVPISAEIFRGRRSLDVVLELAITSIARGAYQGLKEVHIIARDKGVQQLLAKQIIPDVMLTLNTDLEALCLKQRPTAGTWPERTVRIMGKSLNFYGKDGKKRGSSLPDVTDYIITKDKEWFSTLWKTLPKIKVDAEKGKRRDVEFALYNEVDAEKFYDALTNISQGKEWDAAPASEPDSEPEPEPEFGEIVDKDTEITITTGVKLPDNTILYDKWSFKTGDVVAIDSTYFGRDGGHAPFLITGIRMKGQEEYQITMKNCFNWNQVVILDNKVIRNVMHPPGHLSYLGTHILELAKTEQI